MYLFVYGTLLKGMPTPMANFLGENASYIGEAYVPGLLVDLGRYPGAIYQPDAETLIYGHVFYLNKPDATLKILDRYEDAGIGQGSRTEYRREQVPVMMGDEAILCWIYLYNLDPIGLPVIPEGNYLEFLAKGIHPRHYEFMGKGRAGENPDEETED